MARPGWRRELQGVVIGGGDDIHPSHYGAPEGGKAVYDPGRDLLESEIIKQALAADVPLLGICRGFQLLNIVQGGTLHQDIRHMHQRVPFRNSPWRVKSVEIERDSKLLDILGRTRLGINSLHHQAVDRCGAGLEVAARDLNGIVQAVESTRHSFVLGVQWHPEYLFYLSEQRRLFHALVQAARRQGRRLPPRSL